MKTKIIVLTATLFLFSACSSKKEIIVKEMSYPTWYINPIENDDNYLYGIGEGKNLDEASKKALINISSKLSTSISSSSNIYEKSYTTYREYIQKDVTQNINTNTENLTYQNYQLDKSEKIKYNQFFVRVKVEKQNLINNLKKEVETLINDSIKKEKDLLQKDSLTRYFEYLDIYNSFYKKQNKVQILKILDTNYNDKIFYNYVDKIKEKIFINKSKISFNIENKTYSEIVSNKIKEELTNKKFEERTSIKAPFKINISSNINKKESHGIYIVDNNISVKIFNKKNLIKTNNYFLKGASSNSFKDALNNSYEEFIFSLN